MWTLIIAIYGVTTGQIPFDTEAQCWRGAVYALQLEEAHERPWGAIKVGCVRAV
jgi:hypothetical protein